MAHKTITISEEAYNILAGHKRPGESFTEAIIRLLHRREKGSLLEHRGKWIGDDEEFERIFTEIDALWHRSEQPEAGTRSA
jgi:predicted CopG family antitoxin